MGRWIVSGPIPSIRHWDGLVGLGVVRGAGRSATICGPQNRPVRGEWRWNLSASLRAQLCNIHQEFVDRLDAAAVLASFEQAQVG
jgi:hypothetical protein